MGQFINRCFFCVEITRMTSSYNSKHSFYNISLEKNYSIYFLILSENAGFL